MKYTGKPCSIPECPKEAKCCGMCAMHYQRQRTHGDPLTVRPRGFQKGALNPSCWPGASKRLSQWKLGRPNTKSMARKASRTMRRRLKEPAMKEKWRLAGIGRRLTAETKMKISAAHARRPKKQSTLVKNLDMIYSLYIRLKDADANGFAPCISCGRRFHFKDLDCGHFVSRRHKSTRFMEENTKPQCRYCNRFNEGMKDSFALQLIQEYGVEILQKLQDEKNKTKHFTSDDLVSLIKDYKSKVNGLKKNRGGDCV